MRSALLAFLASGLMSCSGLKEMYGEEHVLYDSRGKATPAPSAPAPGSAQSVDFARILVLEQVRGELERAILDGLDTDGALAQKRRAVDEELKGRVAAAGDQLGPWRAARAAELKQFATSK